MAIVLALSAALAYGVSDYVGGRASRRYPPLAVTALAELVLAPVVVLLVVLFEDDRWTTKGMLWGLGAGIAGSVGVLGLYMALARGNMAVIAPLTGLVAAVVPAVIGIVLGDRPGAVTLIGIAVAIAGGALIGDLASARLARLDLPTIAAIIVVGSLFGLLFVAYDVAGDDAGLWPLLGARISAVVFLLTVYALARARDLVPRPGPGVFGPVVAVGVLIAAANTFYLLSTRRGLLVVVAVLVSLYPASTIALAAIVDRERISWSQATGMVLAVVAVVTITISTT